MRAFVEIIMAIVGAVGFSLVFNIHGHKLFITAAGGALTWGVYLLIDGLGGNVFISCLAATCASMLFAEVMARVAKTPVIILLVPMLIPMIPGGDLYYMMANLVMDQPTLVRAYGQQLVMEIGAIAFGIILVSTGFQIALRVRQWRSGEHHGHAHHI